MDRKRRWGGWALVLLALALRIGVAGMAQPAAVIEQRALLAVSCDGVGHDGGAPGHGRSADADQNALLLVAEVSAAAAELRVAAIVPMPVAPVPVAPARRLPPGRGPPPATARVGAPRAPPLLA